MVIDGGRVVLALECEEGSGLSLTYCCIIVSSPHHLLLSEQLHSGWSASRQLWERPSSRLMSISNVCVVWQKEYIRRDAPKTTVTSASLHRLGLT